MLTANDSATAIDLVFPSDYDTSKAHRAAQVAEANIVFGLNVNSYHSTNYIKKGEESLYRRVSYIGIDVGIEFKAQKGEIKIARVFIKPDCLRVGMPPADSKTLEGVVIKVEEILSKSSIGHKLVSQI